MRVLYWVERFWPNIGGVEVLSMQLLTALQQRGYEFAVITSHDRLTLPKEEQYHGIEIYRFPFQPALSNHDLTALKAIRQQVAALRKSFKPSVVHINSVEPSIFFQQHTDRIYPAPVLMTVHSPFYTSERNSLLGRLLSSAEWVVAVSDAILHDVRELIPEVTSRSGVIYNGLVMPHLKPTPLVFDKPRIVCLGRVVVEKGFDVALDAFARIIDQFPEARLVIAGDGPARPALEAQTTRLGLGNVVEFTGWVSPEQVPELIANATIVVVPSRWREPFGLVAVEAAQMARPIVATRVGGLPEVVLHHKTGLLVENEDHVALADHVAFLLQHPERATQMGQAAYRRAQDVFSMERFVNDYDVLYHRLVMTACNAQGAEV